MENTGYLRVRVLASGQVIDVVRPYALSMIARGTAVPATDEPVETFGERLSNVVEIAARFVKQAVRPVAKPARVLPGGFGRA